MNITINLAPLMEFLQQDPYAILWDFMAYYGWIIIGIFYLGFAKEAWLIYREEKWGANIKHIMLAIDIPRANAQSPQAVENLFTYLGGAHGSINWFEKWWEGKYQLSFSFEVVSIDGYTQFLIRTPLDFRQLVETAVYSQYPDAEISEVDDYAEPIPRHFPNSDYDVWGAEFIQSAHPALPIKLYREFEHQLGPSETTFRDPMASLMDLCSSLQKGEQLWYQIIIIPTDFGWIADAEPQIDKILGKKPSVSFFNNITDSSLKVIEGISEAIFSLWGDIEDKEKEFKVRSMMELRPKEKKQIEAMHQKISKQGFLAKVRFVYVAKKEVFNPKKTVNGFVGYIKQFMALDLNNLKPDMKHTATSTQYFNKINRLNEKKANIVNNYINRSGYGGRNPQIYNIEELATIWHFPIEEVSKAPLVQKAPMKKSKPPMSLPSEQTSAFQDSLQPLYSIESSAPARTESKSEAVITEVKAKGEAPTNLPFA